MTYLSDRELRVRGNVRVGNNLTVAGTTSNTGAVTFSSTVQMGSGSDYAMGEPNATTIQFMQMSTMTIAATNSSTSVTFPTAYSVAPKAVIIQNINSAADATATVFRTAASDISATAFIAKANNTATNIVTLGWLTYSTI